MIGKVGFMQGRLCDPINGLIQSFPIKNWQKEFEIAESIGINLMEWTLDSIGLYQNPLFNVAGRKRILSMQRVGAEVA